MFSESHCHLGAITPDLITKAEENGFTILLTSGIDLESSIEAVKIAEKYSIVKASVGIHPWYADEYNEEVQDKFIKLAKSPEVIAISEIGLDFVGRMTKEWVREDRYIDKDIQVEAFKQQLKLAEKLGYPAIIHDRVPNQEILDMLEEINVKTGIAIHGFSKGPDYAKRAIKNRILLSIGLGTIKRREHNLIKAIKDTPMEYLLTETDSSTPQGVLTLCDKIAEIKGVSRTEIGTQATKNLMKLCNL